MCDVMMFPDTAEEFMEQYKIVDTEQVYTNGAELIPIFRMKQWLEHLQDIEPERKTGQWIHKGGGSFICSDCGEMVGLNTYRSERACEIFLYCPHCGARMKGDENETG